MTKRILLLLLCVFCVARPLFASTGIVVGSPVFGTAKFSNGLTATNDSSYISLPAGDLNITATSSWTIESWLKISSSSLSSGPVAIMLGNSASGYIWIGVHSNGHLWAGVTGSAGAFNNAPNLDSGISIDDNNWHHCVVEVSGGTVLTFYVDGVAGASFTGQLNPITTTGAIGRFTLATGASWPGSIDEVSFWSVNKYTANFTPPTSPYLGTEANLAALYHLQSDGTDSSPNGNGTSPVGPSTVVGSPTFGPAKFSNGLIATSDSNYISLPAGDLSITATSSWTIESWLKVPSSGLSSGPVAIMLGNTMSGYIWIGVHSNGHLWAGVAGVSGAFNGPTNLDSGITINDNSWHHCVVEVSGGTVLTFYVDGNLGASFTGQINPVSTPGAIGRFTLSAGASWPGSIDEVSLWKVNKYTGSVFTPPASPYVGTEANLVALYHLETDATNSSSSGNTTLSVTTASLASASTGTAYSQTLTASGGTSPYVWSLPSGSLPAGLSLSPSTGTISGTPTTGGANNFTVQVTDNAGNTATANLSITVSAAFNIAPNSSAIVYSPYNWVVTGSSATTINAGAYFRTIFSGTSVALLTNTANNLSPYSELWARVDGDAWQELTLAPGNPTLSIATGLASRNHYLEVVVKSTSQVNSRWAANAASMVTITGLQFDSGATVEAPARRAKNILYYGASQDEGVRTVNATAPLDTDQSDVLVSFAYSLAEATDSEVGLVAFAGTGITTTNAAGGVPALTSSYNVVYPGSPRSFSPAPDLVVYNEGFNDGSNNITAPFETIINGIMSAAPNAKQLLLVPFNQTHVSEIQAAVAAVNSPNVTWQATSPGWYSTADTSDGQHPYGYWDLGYISPLLSPIVQRLLYPPGP